MNTKEKNMNDKSRLNMNVNKELKEEAMNTLNDLGLDLTTAVTIYLKQIVKKKRIPFEISTTSYYTIDEVAGGDWRNEIRDVKDEWE